MKVEWSFWDDDFMFRHRISEIDQIQADYRMEYSEQIKV